MRGPLSGRVVPLLPPNELELFWSRVDKGSADECWIWNFTVVNGYGMFWSPSCKFSFRSHRVAYRTLEEIPDGKVVAHRCDNPTCVNPAHLFLTDQLGNMKDRTAKCRTNIPIGESNHQHKLSNRQVLEIRRDCKLPTSKSNTEVFAIKYGVSIHTIEDIVYGASWRHLLESDACNSNTVLIN